MLDTVSDDVLDSVVSEKIVDHGTCRLCGERLKTTVADLGMSPLANSYISDENRNRMEPFYPLHTLICDNCHLVQLEAFETPHSIFGDYLYFSSYSTSWLAHARNYVEKQVARFGLGPSSLIVEIASNDGYLLQYAMEKGVPVLGVEPAANVAEVAMAKGIRTEVAFFGEETALRLRERGYAADLMAANNVVAHVPNLHDFLEGFRILLSENGVVTFEFPHLMKMIEETQFDTIYHEHFSYFSLGTISRVLAMHDLRVFDVEELPTHGGSLRVYATHKGSTSNPQEACVNELLQRERAAGLEDMATYRAFATRILDIKNDLLKLLIEAQQKGLRVAGYGAPAKGNTLLNYCGVGPEYISFTVDMSPHKQQMLLPGTRIPIAAPEALRTFRPDLIVILPWNLKEEIMTQLDFVREWGCRFVLPIPQVSIV